MGLVLIYKATRVPNFAYGGHGHVRRLLPLRPRHRADRLGSTSTCSYLHVDFDATVQLPFWGALPVTLVVAAAPGLADRTRRHPPLRPSGPMVRTSSSSLAASTCSSPRSPAALRRRGPDRQQRQRHLLRARPCCLLGGVNCQLRALGVDRHRRRPAIATWRLLPLHGHRPRHSRRRPPTPTSRPCSACRPGNSRSSRGWAVRWSAAVAGDRAGVGRHLLEPEPSSPAVDQGLRRRHRRRHGQLPDRGGRGFGIGLVDELVRQTSVQENDPCCGRARPRSSPWARSSSCSPCARRGSSRGSARTRTPA